MFDVGKLPALALFCLLMVLGPVSGGSVRKMSLRELINEADLIFVGEVISVESQWNKERTKIYTYVSFSVKQTIKGKLEEAKKTIRLLGGEVEGEALWVEGVPQFKEEEIDLIFLKAEEAPYSPIVGLFQGRFRVEKIGKDEAAKEVVLDNFGNYLVGIDEEGNIITALRAEAKEKMLLESFIMHIEKILKVKEN